MKRFRGLALAGLVAGGCLCAAWAQANPVDLAAHRATYHMSLSSSRSGSGMANASGTWSYAFRDSCDAWVTEFRLALTYSYAEGGQADTVTDFLGWESKDGLRYHFRVRQSRDGEVTDEVEGTARLSGPGQGGIARFTRPEPHQIRLPKGTLFPTAHTLRLLTLAERGEQALARPLFDGQGDEGPFETSARIGRVITTPPDGQADPLLAPPAWPMRMAFFPTRGSNPLPDFEMALVYHANGVARDIEQIFPNFSLHGKLDSIEALPRPRC